MKFLIPAIVAILLFSSGECLTAEQRKMMLDLHNACMVESGATDDMIKDAMTGKFPDTPVFKQHLFCLSKKFGFQDESGAIQTVVTTKKIREFVTDENRANDIIDMCLTPKDTPEETAFVVAKCIFEVKHS